MRALYCFLFLPLTWAVIQIRQGATTQKIHLARPYSLKQFRAELMGKNGYHNLDFAKATPQEIGHLPDDLFLKLNGKQVRQVLEGYKAELALGRNPMPYTNALHQLFATAAARKAKRVNLLKPRDVDAIGFDPHFIPIASLPKNLLSHLVTRWSARSTSAVVQKELQSLVLDELAKNKHLKSVSLKKKFFENLHSQQTIEHWPAALKSLSKKAGATSSSLNKELGVSDSGSSDADSTSETDESSETSQGSASVDESSEPRSSRKKRPPKTMRKTSALLKKRGHRDR